ncbi:unnamed protein product [Rotaria sp. Silwood1]|nr:unnamed protein product [Rotaria sp. Silwood1]CAF1459100.1 unnamed protein product [Rotaria sp. Silwood1]
MSRTNISPLIKAQLEKLTAAGIDITSGHRPIRSSPPIIISTKSTHSNTSSQSSSYTSIPDQMSSSGETSLQLHREFDNTSNTSLPILSSNCQRLEHSAARNRIAVKNQRKQPIKHKLSILKENNDNEFDLFSSKFDDEEENFPSHIESKIQSKSVMDLSNFDKEQNHFFNSLRPRDHSVDNIHSTTFTTPTYISSVQRSISFKCPQEFNQTTFTIKKDEENKHESTLKDINQNNSYSSSQEHIYDNSNLFQHHKTNILSNENQLSTNNIIKTRERLIPITNRIRPLTVHIPTNNDKQTINEYENVLNQIKKPSLIKKIQHKEEQETVPTLSVVDESIQTPSSSILIEDTSKILSTEHELIVPVVIPTKKLVETSSVSQPPDRRKTVGGVNLPTNNKVTTNTNQSIPSWIDIAKQKQNKLRAALIEKSQSEESEKITSIEPDIVPKKQVISSSKPITTVKETTSNDTPTFNPSIIRRLSSRVPQTNTHIVERDSIRALKANNPNRINNLINFFDK